MSDEGRGEERFALTCSAKIPDLLASSNSALAFSTYQAGKLFFIGTTSEGRLSVFERTFARSMGIGVSDDGRSLALATQYQIHRFDNVMEAPGSDEWDALYAPHASWVTGDVDAHDVGFGPEGRPIFVNTLFSCIASVSDGHSFRPYWMPPYVSRLAPEDRCHLNGMALENGRPRFATAISRSDVADGWRDRRLDGGIALDIDSNEIIAAGLSMPHSPRVHAGRLWLVNSGTGEIGFVDRNDGRFEGIAFCPGYARGLAFIGDCAVIGLSLPRQVGAFAGLSLDEQLKRHGAEARCGLIFIDLVSGNSVGWVRIEGVVRELYDVAVLPGVRNPSLVGFKGNEIRYVISIDD